MFKVIVDCKQKTPSNWNGKWDNKILNKYLNSNNLINIGECRDGVTQTRLRDGDKYLIGFHSNFSYVYIEWRATLDQEHIVIECESIDDIMDVITNSEFSKHFNLDSVHKNKDKFIESLKVIYGDDEED